MEIGRIALGRYWNWSGRQPLHALAGRMPFCVPLNSLFSGVFWVRNGSHGHFEPVAIHSKSAAASTMSRRNRHSSYIRISRTSAISRFVECWASFVARQEEYNAGKGNAPTFAVYVKRRRAVHMAV